MRIRSYVYAKPVLIDRPGEAELMGGPVICEDCPGDETNYPDGLTVEAIEALLLEARPHWDRPSRATSALLDGSAVQRRERREERRAFASVVRALPARSAYVVPDGEVA